MSSNQPSQRGQNLPHLADIKARGANRSTKVAGKLKVLPDQPEPVVPVDKVEPPPPPRRDELESSATAEESEEDEGEEATTEDTEDVEVNRACLLSAYLLSESPSVCQVYNQIDRIPAGTARRDALRLTKKKAKSLPRVTAYATASSYRFPELMRFFNARKPSYHTAPRIIDEVIYTPYVYEPPSSRHVHFNQSRQASEADSEVTAQAHTGDLLGVPELVPGESIPGRIEASTTPDSNGVVRQKKKSKFEEMPTVAEIFLFEYGTVVIWGMTEAEEKRFLSSIKRFEVDKLPSEDVEMEDLNYYYANYSRTKLSLSHALSQSVKISLFEELISSTIDETKDIPEIISETGKINMPHKEIMRKIGELFLLRTNINSVGSVLDSPVSHPPPICIFASRVLDEGTYPDLQPLYDAARSYLEIPQRINLLNARVEVLQDMLQLLKETVSSRHAERLETIVIWLIVVEIGLGIITILHLYHTIVYVLVDTTSFLPLFLPRCCCFPAARKARRSCQTAALRALLVNRAYRGIYHGRQFWDWQFSPPYFLLGIIDPSMQASVKQLRNTPGATY
ncbi:hypothetical protein NM688_g2165 [Phlebia brevispora]|uniref:Uncharacterized protein n=1 Tax=Phlebia brevispora TaxID=194682 RepID=A0ACC1T9N4_9APHY|nr:hypothetical protein NM688_g2165 [Phlebia brevispora]